MMVKNVNRRHKPRNGGGQWWDCDIFDSFVVSDGEQRGSGDDDLGHDVGDWRIADHGVMMMIMVSVDVADGDDDDD